MLRLTMKVGILNNIPLSRHVSCIIGLNDLSLHDIIDIPFVGNYLFNPSKTPEKSL